MEVIFLLLFPQIIVVDSCHFDRRALLWDPLSCVWVCISVKTEKKIDLMYA